MHYFREDAPRSRAMRNDVVKRKRISSATRRKVSGETILQQLARIIMFNHHVASSSFTKPSAREITSPIQLWLIRHKTTLVPRVVFRRSFPNLASSFPEFALINVVSRPPRFSRPSPAIIATESNLDTGRRLARRRGLLARSKSPPDVPGGRWRARLTERS